MDEEQLERIIEEVSFYKQKLEVHEDFTEEEITIFLSQYHEYLLSYI